jgi:hypothetical protein
MIVLLALMILSTPAASADPYMATYQAELRRQCPSKHLERMADAVLFDRIDAFMVQAATAARLRSAIDRDCATETAGFSCSVRSNLHVLEKAGLTRPFTASVCAAYRGCEEQALCTPASPSR